jgi:hypothetical protein
MQSGRLTSSCYNTQVSFRTPKPKAEHTATTRRAITEPRAAIIGKQFVIYTDHKALLRFLDTPIDSMRLSKWTNFMSQFQFTIKHRPGKENELLTPYLVKLLARRSLMILDGHLSLIQVILTELHSMHNWVLY